MLGFRDGFRVWHFKSYHHEAPSTQESKMVMRGVEGWGGRGGSLNTG